MSEKIIATVAIVAFAVFVGYTALKIMEPSLIVIALAVIAMGAYDFYVELKANGTKG